MLNKADNDSFSDLFSDYPKTIDHLNLKSLMFFRQTTSFKILIFKFRILEILNFHPWIYTMEHPDFIVLALWKIPLVWKGLNIPREE